MVGNIWWSAVCVAAVVCFLGSAAAGQPSQGSVQPAAKKKLDPITVTATRNPIRSFEYPGMVTVVGQDSIRSRQASTVGNLLDQVPNVQFSGGPRRTGQVPSIRGFSGADVIVLLDGARQNFGSAHDGRFFIDPSLLKRVEVLRGSASSLYGSGGTGGVFDFRTLDAADLLDSGRKFGARISGGYRGANRERVGSVTLYGRPGDGLDFVASATKRNSGTISLGDGNEIKDADDDIITGLAKASYEFAQGHRIEGAFVIFNNKAREPNNGQHVDNTTAPGLVDKEIRSTTFRVGYSYKDPRNPLIDLDLVAYRTDIKADEQRLDDEGTGPKGQLLKRDVDTMGVRIDNRSRFKLSDTFAATLTYGGEFYRDSQDGAAGSGERDGVPDADANFYGLFAQSELALAEPGGFLPGDALIVLGVRYDAYSTSGSSGADNRKDSFSPKIGISYLPTDWLMIFGSYAHAFRAPTINEIYLTGTHFRIPLGQISVANRFVPNPDLKPQTTRTLEVGGGLSFDDVVRRHDSLRFKASRFWIEGDDFIDLSVNQPPTFGPRGPNPACFVPGTCDGTTTAQNVAKARLQGTEIEASYENARMFVSLGFSTIDGKNEKTGKKLGVLTPDRYTVNAALKLPEIDSVLGWRLLAARKFDKVNDPADERDAYTVHDFYFSWLPSDEMLKGLRVDLGVDNAFDTAYSHAVTRATEPGRDFKVSLSYSVAW